MTKTKIANLLSHPFTLLVLGAIISSLLIPYYTRQWQDYQKELELKTDIASQISKAISNIIITSRLTQNPNLMDQMDFGSASVEWEMSKATIGSQIQSYFQNAQLIQDWKNLSEAITEFVQLSAGVSQSDSNYKDKICLRIKHILNIQKYISLNDPIFLRNNPNNINMTELGSYECWNTEEQLGLENDNNVGNTSIDWNTLAHKELFQSGRTYQIQYSNSWFNLEKYIENRKDDFIQSIVTSDIIGF